MNEKKHHHHNEKGVLVKGLRSPIFNLVVQVVCLLIPAFLTAYAYKKNNILIEQRYLKYWLTMVPLILIEKILMPLLKKYPFWIIIKLVFFVGLISSNFMINLIYDNFTRPLFVYVSPYITKLLTFTNRRITDLRDQNPILNVAVQAAIQKG